MRKNLIVAFILFGALSVSAREYQHSAGVIVGNSFGLSYKGYIRSSEHMVIETNLMTTLLAPGSWSERLTIAGGNSNSQKSGASDWVKVPAGNCDFLTFVANPNFYYQAQAADFNWAVMNWYAGGGIGLGALWGTANHFKTIEGFGEIDDQPKQTPALKIDEHAVIGIEFCFKNAPLNLSVDFRPGLGEFAYITSGSMGQTSATVGLEGMFFDWTLGVALRYRIGQ